MGIIATFIIGLVVGLLARMLKPGPDRLGIIMTSLLGVAGAFLANWLGHASGWYLPGEAAGFIASTLGAMLILFIAEALSGDRSKRFH